jgi:outer membrane cobalamin receptor
MASSRVAIHAPRWVSAAVEGRYVGARYDDDLNTIRLDDFFLVGLRLNRDLGRGISAHLKIENLFNEDFEIARSRSGEAEMGAPRWITAGLRAQW